MESAIDGYPAKLNKWGLGIDVFMTYLFTKISNRPVSRILKFLPEILEWKWVKFKQDHPQPASMVVSSSVQKEFEFRCAWLNHLAHLFKLTCYSVNFFFLCKALIAHDGYRQCTPLLFFLLFEMIKRLIQNVWSRSW